jgi:predicted amidophosphoribosyltransferase
MNDEDKNDVGLQEPVNLCRECGEELPSDGAFWCSDMCRAFASEANEADRAGVEQ